MQGTLKRGEIISPLTIETLVNGGAGLARHEGRVVFIPHSAVGDIVSCRVRKIKKNFIEADIDKVLTPSALRRKSPCPVAGQCGGCQWQHLPYSEQLNSKESLFRESLVRQCGVHPEKILSIAPSEDEWNYRSRVQVKCSNTKSGFVTGFFRPKSHSIVSVKQCLILSPDLESLLGKIRKVVDGTAHADFVARIDLAIDDANQCSAVIYYSGRDSESFSDVLRDESFAANLYIKEGTKVNLIRDQGRGGMQIMVDQPSIRLSYDVGSFSQINLNQNRTLVNLALAQAELTGEESVLDLYCGMGNFSLPFARRVKSVIGVEESTISIENARKNSHQNEINNVAFYARSAEGALGHFSNQSRVDMVLLDPPRSGAIHTMGELLSTPVSKVLYISCDTQTLARDLKILVNGGYEIISSRPVDMFPQTHHCESITFLRYRP